MEGQLRARRDRAAERHDAALARYPTRRGSAFARELQGVIRDLGEVAREADDPRSDPVEVAKTYRWLGDAYFDLGNGTAEDLLTRGAQAYRRAEELLQHAAAPVEKAKLDFNYGNTLRGLSQGTDVGLLEAAETRYQAAAKAFRAYHLPDLAATVEQQLRTIEPQVRLARKGAELERGSASLKEAAGRLEGADAVERERIAAALDGVRAVAGRGDPSASLAELLAAVREETERHPERVTDAAGRLEALQDQVAAFADLLADEQAPEQSQPGLRGPERDLAQALMERLQRERAAGTVSPERAAELRSVFTRFTEVMSEGGDDLEALASRASRMRGLLQQAMDPALAPSWKTPPPKPGSAAQRAVAVLEPLKRYLVAEAGRGMQPSAERSTGTDLLVRLVQLEASIREAQDDEGRVAGHEDRLWRLALAVQRHARRYHLTVAQPDFPMATPHAAAKSVFLSGGSRLRAVGQRLAAARSLVLLDRAGRGDRARERWGQVCSASAAVFDLGVDGGADRAQVCYELGLALALGKPTVVVARPRQRMPFNVNLTPVRWRGDAAADVELLGEAIDSALGSIVWGGLDSGLGAGPRDALGWLERRFGQRLAEGTLGVARRLAESKRDDAVAFHGALEQLLGLLGAEAPALLFPAWPPAYPARERRLFHVMPFRPGWAGPTRDLAAETCRAGDWTYTRGDEADAQRVLRGIWSEIGRASAVLIDITGHNPNVALELGLVHALGRPYRVVAQRPVERHVFPSLEKVQIHGYGRAPGFSGFRKVVGELLS